MSLLLRILVVGIASASAIAVSSSRPESISPFDPGGFVCFEQFETPQICDGDPSPGAASDIRIRACLGWDDMCAVKDSNVDDSAPAFLVGFVPKDFQLARGTDMPTGAIVGRVGSEQTYGILNNPCSTTLVANLTLLNGSTDSADEVSPALAALDTNGNGIQEGVERYPSFLNEVIDGQARARYVGMTLVQGLWYMVNAVLLEPGSAVHSQTGTLRFDSALGYPVVFVLGDPTEEPVPGPISDFCAPFFADLVLFGSSMDNPCTPVPVPGAACPGGGTPIFENRGYPLLPCETGNAHDEDGDGATNDGCPQIFSVSEGDIPGSCDNAISDDGEDSDVNDGCPQVGPLSESERLPGSCSGANEGGCHSISNPLTPGSYDITAFAVGYRDADGDGIENPLDVCALTPNSGWDPRSFDPVNDPDNDGLPNECDPEPAVSSSQVGCHPSGITGPDEDLDCFSNRQDNCPLVAQLADPAQLPGPANPPNQKDADADGIGDACDPNPETPDGDRPAACLTASLDVGAVGGIAVATKDFSGFGCVGSFESDCHDLNDDGRVNGRDVAIVARSLFSEPGHKRWNPDADVNHDNVVNPDDMFEVISSMHDPECNPNRIRGRSGRLSGPQA